MLRNHVQETPMPAPDEPLLAGPTVLDFTRVLAGPYCTRLLSDLGARVIKIERPGEGDDTRRGHAQMEEGRADQATYFIRINAGKSSLALDLSHPKAREVVLDLARAVDVVVETFLPGVIAKLGCDYAALSAVKPGLVYCSISGFGQSGPLRHQPAFHHIVNTSSTPCRGSCTWSSRAIRRRGPGISRRPTCSPARTPSGRSWPRYGAERRRAAARISTSRCSSVSWAPRTSTTAAC